jgi:hypothetical protein
MEIPPVAATSTHSRRAILRAELRILWLLLITMTLVPLYVEGLTSFLATLLNIAVTRSNRTALSLTAFTVFGAIAWAWKRSWRWGVFVQIITLLFSVIWLWFIDRRPLTSWLEYLPTLIGAAVIVGVLISILAAVRRPRFRTPPHVDG